MVELPLLPRYASGALARLLAVHPVVVLTGARQTGKSTLVQQPPVADGRLYLTLDDLGVWDDARTWWGQRPPVRVLPNRRPGCIIQLMTLYKRFTMDRLWTSC